MLNQWPWLVPLAAAMMGTATAQDYPGRPIRLIVGYAPGGTTDFTARVVAPRLAEGLGQSVVVDNRPGAGAIVGTNLVARANPDGYTLLLADTAFGIVPAIYAKQPFDALREFAPMFIAGEIAGWKTVALAGNIKAE